MEVLPDRNHRQDKNRSAGSALAKADCRPHDKGNWRIEYRGQEAALDRASVRMKDNRADDCEANDEKARLDPSPGSRQDPGLFVRPDHHGRPDRDTSQCIREEPVQPIRAVIPVSYTHLRAHETPE